MDRCEKKVWRALYDERERLVAFVEGEKEGLLTKLILHLVASEEELKKLYMACDPNLNGIPNERWIQKHFQIKQRVPDPVTWKKRDTMNLLKHVARYRIIGAVEPEIVK